MAWVRVDDNVPHHPKHLAAGPVACWLWICGIAYAQRQLTNGFVPDAALPSLGVTSPQKYVNRLVRAGLWHKVEGGYQIHDYLEHNARAEDVKADREWDRRRKALYADQALVEAIKIRDAGRCRYCGEQVHWTDRRGPSGAQLDYVEPRGPNSYDNVVVSCRRCNIRKGNRSIATVNMTLLPPGTSSDLVPGTSSELGPIYPTSFARALPGDGMGTDRSRTKYQDGEGSGKGTTQPLVTRRRLSAAFEWRVCVPTSLHAEFIGKLGGDRQAAEQKLWTWYAATAKAWDEPEERAIGDDDFAFWRARFSEWQGTTRKPVDVKRGVDVDAWAEKIAAEQVKRAARSTS